MDSLQYTFKDLSNSILSLFEKNSSSAYMYNCINVLGGTVAMMELNYIVIELFIGDIGNFYEWLKPKLYKFFENYNYVYESVVKSKSCKRIAFKRKMMKELYLDISAFISDGNFVGKYTDTEKNRLILFFNCIKNYIYRLFLINIHCSP